MSTIEKLNKQDKAPFDGYLLSEEEYLQMKKDMEILDIMEKEMII